MPLVDSSEQPATVPCIFRALGLAGAGEPAAEPLQGGYDMAVSARCGATKDVAIATQAREEQMKQYWLMKSEPAEASVDDFLAAPAATIPWTGVRNYQARNFMRDHMRIDDGVLFYHSSCAEPGVVGVARVASAPYPDPTQFDPKSPYFDEASMQDSPRWVLVDVQVLEKTRTLGLPEMRSVPELADMLVLRKGNRLSITPVDPKHWQLVTRLLHD